MYPRNTVQDWVFVCFFFLNAIIPLYSVSPIFQFCITLELLIKKKDYKVIGNKLIKGCKWVILTVCS